MTAMRSVESKDLETVISCKSYCFGLVEQNFIY